MGGQNGFVGGQPVLYTPGTMSMEVHKKGQSGGCNHILEASLAHQEASATLGSHDPYGNQQAPLDGPIPHSHT